MATLEPRHEFLYPGKNGIETSVAIMGVVSGLKGVKRTMEQETVKEIFRRLNAGGIRYVVIGGLAYAEYAPPRATQDVDILVLSEDVPRVRALFPGCYVRGTAIAGIYDVQGTRLDVQPALRKAQTEAVRNAVPGDFHGEPLKVAGLRDLIFLKLWAMFERRDLNKKLLDQADMAGLLSYNGQQISAQDIASIAGGLLAMAYTAEDAARHRAAVAWLNETLVQLGMGDRTFQLPAGGGP
jgi:hypothetical protein